jgi:hypothetical protein
VAPKRLLKTKTYAPHANREIKCYGSYIIPVLLVFGVLAIGLSLGVYGKKNGWFAGH